MIDRAKVYVRSGKGGDGSFSFRREKYIPKGGPDGGDGGKGGSVWLVADANQTTLERWVGTKKVAAPDGEPGSRQKMFGKNGDDIEIALPLGTVVWELIEPSEEPESTTSLEEEAAEASEITGETPTEDSDSQRSATYGGLQKRLVTEILSPTDRYCIARGGQGGRGNVHFKSASNRTPLEYEKGAAAEEKTLLFELKLIADVGLVGFPNAGKSTLLSVVTQARPKIADYPFTTLDPNLGVMRVELTGEAVSYVLADIPGLIEKASEGKGLGFHFLRHIERCKALVFVLSPRLDMVFSEADQEGGEAAAVEGALFSQRLAEDCWQQLQTLRQELAAYNEELAQRPSRVVVNKADLLSNDDQEAILEYLSGRGVEVLFMSAQQRLGLETFGAMLHELVQTARTAGVEAGADSAGVQDISESLAAEVSGRTPGAHDVDALESPMMPVFRPHFAQKRNKPTLAYRTPLKKG